MSEFFAAYEQTVDGLLETASVIRSIRVVLAEQEGKEAAMELLNESAHCLESLMTRVETMYALHVRGEKEAESSAFHEGSAALSAAV